MTDVDKVRRGRPRTFSTEEAMATISDLFRMHGFDGTSLDMIAKSTGLTRPSLNAAFGNKENMFLLAMDQFAQDAAASAGPKLLSGESIEDSLSLFYRAMVDQYVSKKTQARGCIVYSTALSAVSSPRIKDRLATYITALTTQLENRLAELAPDQKKARIKAASEQAFATLVSLSALASSGATRKDLYQRAERAASMIAEFCEN